MTVLSVRDLDIRLPAGSKRNYAVNDISLNVKAGETLCVIGESGSGKSTLGLSLIDLLDTSLTQERGVVSLYSNKTGSVMDEALEALRGRFITMIFQEPSSALNPLLSCGYQVDEVLKQHTNLDEKDRKDRIFKLFRRISLPDTDEFYARYPHQLSGGQKQRILIAIATILNPGVLICDEPTTALDVTTQQQILDLIKDLQGELNIAVIFITHDIRIVADIADHVVVMKDGVMVEAGDRNKVLRNPEHPYTRHLIRLVPRFADFREEEPDSITVSRSRVMRVMSLIKSFSMKRVLGSHEPVKAVSDVSFDLYGGEILGIVGESGSGKSTLARCLAGLLPITSGVIEFQDMQYTSHSSMRDLRNIAQMIFQDPYRSFNPSLTVGESIIEGLLNRKVPRDTAIKQAAELLSRVSLDRSALDRYPSAFSGGERQRLCIVRALVMSPRILIADEATSALDVSTQKTLTELFMSLRDATGLTIVFITHDLILASSLCDRLIVLKNGVIQELGDTKKIMKNPSSGYTRTLLDAIPGRDVIDSLNYG